MTIGVVGLGLIGGSFAIAVKEFSQDVHIIGADKSPEHCQKALEIGLVDHVDSLENVCQQVDILILAIPVDATVALLPEILNKVSAKTTVIDMGSTKGPICEAVENHPNRKQFVAAHPMAGTEFSGPQAAIPHLYTNKVVVLCDREKSAPEHYGKAYNLFEIINMKVLEMSAKDHDLHAAYVSHISHISSFVLASTVLEIEKNEASIFNLASGGFASTVRLAKSSADMWTPIFSQNKTNVLTALNTYIDKLESFRNKILKEDSEGVRQEIIEANKIKKILDKPKNIGDKRENFIISST